MLRIIEVEKIELVLLSTGVPSHLAPYVSASPLMFAEEKLFSARQSVREFRDIVSLSIPPIKRHVYSAARRKHGQKPRRFGYLFSFRKVNPPTRWTRTVTQHLSVRYRRVANSFSGRGATKGRREHGRILQRKSVKVSQTWRN